MKYSSSKIRRPFVLSTLLICIFFQILPNQVYASRGQFQCTGGDQSQYEIDWEKEGLWENNPIKSQGIIGSCHSFTTIGLIEALLKKKFNKTIILSEAHLFWYHLLSNNSQQSILKYFKKDKKKYLSLKEGGHFSQNMKYIKDIGLCEQNDLNYSYRDLTQNIIRLKGNYNTLVNELAQGKHQSLMNNFNDTDFFEIINKNISIDLFSKEEFANKSCNKDKFNIDQIKHLNLFYNIEDTNLKNELIRKILEIAPLGIAIKNFTELKYGIDKKAKASQQETNLTSSHGVILAGVNCQNKAVIRNSWGEQSTLKVNRDLMMKKMFLADIILDGQREEDILNEVLLNFTEKQIEQNKISNLEDLNKIPLLKNKENRKHLIRKIIQNNKILKDDNSILSVIALASKTYDQATKDEAFRMILNRIHQRNLSASNKIRLPLLQLVAFSQNKKTYLSTPAGINFIQRWIPDISSENLIYVHSHIYSSLTNIQDIAKKNKLMNSYLQRTIDFSLTEGKSYLNLQLPLIYHLGHYQALNINPKSFDQYLVLTLSDDKNIYHTQNLIKHGHNKNRVMEEVLNHHKIQKTLSYQVLYHIIHNTSKYIDQHSSSLLSSLDNIYQNHMQNLSTIEKKNIKGILRNIFKHSANPELSWTKELITSNNENDLITFRTAYQNIRNNSFLKNEYENMLIENIHRRNVYLVTIDSYKSFSTTNKNKLIKKMLQKTLSATGINSKKLILADVIKIIKSNSSSSHLSFDYYQTLLKIISNKENTRKMGTNPSNWIISFDKNELSSDQKQKLSRLSNSIKEPIYFMKKYKYYFINFFK